MFRVFFVQANGLIQLAGPGTSTVFPRRLCGRRPEPRLSYSRVAGPWSRPSAARRARASVSRAERPAESPRRGPAFKCYARGCGRRSSGGEQSERPRRVRQLRKHSGTLSKRVSLWYGRAAPNAARFGEATAPVGPAGLVAYLRYGRPSAARPPPRDTMRGRTATCGACLAQAKSAGRRAAPRASPSPTGPAAPHGREGNTRGTGGPASRGQSPQ